jgi:CrcB protein
MLKLTLIFLASGLGGLLRYIFGAAIQHWWGPSFPLGTLIVNITGCLAMGFLATAFSTTLHIREEFRLAILVGILGGYTTFSSFSGETLALTTAGEWLKASLYVLLSVAISLLAAYAGAALATKLFPAAPTT